MMNLHNFCLQVVTKPSEKRFVLSLPRNKEEKKPSLQFWKNQHFRNLNGDSYSYALWDDLCCKRMSMEIMNVLKRSFFHEIQKRFCFVFSFSEETATFFTSTRIKVKFKHQAIFRHMARYVHWARKPTQLSYLNLVQSKLNVHLLNLCLSFF